MKELELRKVAKCVICGEKIMHAGIPLFWRVRIERYGLKADAIKRQQGLDMMISPHLAQVMGPDEDMAEKFFSIEITVCETCASEKSLPVAVLAEMGDAEVPKPKPKSGVQKLPGIEVNEDD